MNIDEFISSAPLEFNEWGTLGVSPIIPLPVVSENEHGLDMSTPSVRKLINVANRFLEKGESYLEVGVLRGVTFASALIGNEAHGIAVDNFSMFDPIGENKSVFWRNVSEFCLLDRASLYEQNYIDFFRSPPDVRVGVYFCDGPHGYDDTLKGLEMAIPILSDRSVILMDDFNADWDGVPQATEEWISRHSANAKMIWNLSTPNGYGVWWNGLAVIEWRL